MELTSAPSDILQIVAAFARRDLSPRQFESWVYANLDELEAWMGPDLGSEVAWFDYGKEAGLWELRERLGRLVQSFNPHACSCLLMPSPSFIGPTEFQDDFVHFEELKQGDQIVPWLHLYRCRDCKTHWVFAREMLIYSTLVVCRVSNTESLDILNGGPWPTEVDRYWKLFRQCNDYGVYVFYIDPMDSIVIPQAMTILAEECPGVTLSEIVDLLPIDHEIARFHIRNVARKKRRLINLNR